MSTSVYCETSRHLTRRGRITLATASALALVVGGAVITSAAPAYPVEYEDSPGWDCTVDGNTVCGVESDGIRYSVSFLNGKPVWVTPVALVP